MHTHFHHYLWVAVATTCLGIPNTSAQAVDKESELIQVLQSDKPAAEKALACKNLAIDGTEKAVPELAKLLSNPQLSSWARIALEAIPGPAADAALRKAADELEGRLLVGMINSIGVRRDLKAVSSLTKRLQDADTEVASAAAVALGHIGNSDATLALRKALKTGRAKLRSAVAEGCVLCAERLHAQGNNDAAIKLYDEVRAADVPTQRIVEATRGAILARDQEGISLLIATFRSDDKRLFQLALATIREFPGSKLDKALASELSRTDASRAALLIQAMTDRSSTVLLPAILAAAQKGDRQVRLSAIESLQRVGNETCLATLLSLADEDDEKLADTATQTLARLPGESVNQSIVELLPKAKDKRHVLLLNLIGQRRINAVDEVIDALKQDDSAVRAAAVTALGEIVTLKELPTLIDHYVRTVETKEAVVAQRALLTASIRMPDREACARRLAIAFRAAPESAQTTLLEILSEVGGDIALKTLAVAVKSKSNQLQDDGSRLLGKWNSVAAAPILLDLAKTGPVEKYRIRALRGYIGLARKFTMPPEQRAEMCRNAFTATERIAERKLVLAVLKLHPSAEGLKVAVEASRVPKLKVDATDAAVEIAGKIGGRGVDTGKLLKGVGLEKVKLEIVKAQYGAGGKQKDVTNVLRKRAGDLRLITLSNKSFNNSFGGDPAPGVVKRLTIQYRINGRPAKASFAENATIILPMPK